MKKSIYIFISLLLLFMVSGCTNKKAIDTKKFIDLANKYDYSYSDVLDQYSSYEYIKEATIIGEIDGWQIEFYILDNSSNAEGMFETNKEIFEKSRGSSSIYYSINAKNSSTYSLTSNGRYMYLSRIENTLIYIDVQEQYKSLVESLVEEIGY